MQGDRKTVKILEILVQDEASVVIKKQAIQIVWHVDEIGGLLSSVDEQPVNQKLEVVLIE